MDTFACLVFGDKIKFGQDSFCKDYYLEDRDISMDTFACLVFGEIGIKESWFG